MMATETTTSARERLNRNLKAEAFADVLQASGITAADITLGDYQEWLDATTLVNRLLHEDYDIPSGDTIQLTIDKLMRRETLRRSLTK